MAGHDDPHDGDREVLGLRGRERPQRSGGIGLRGRERPQRSGDVTRHFLDVDDLDTDELDAVLDAAEIPPREIADTLSGRGAALLFEKPSLRTRSSMEVAIAQLGGHPVTIVGDEVGIDTRETAEDVARVLSRYH